MSAIDAYGFAVADVEVARELRGGRGVLLVRAPDAEDVGVAHARETPADGSAR